MGRKARESTAGVPGGGDPRPPEPDPGQGQGGLPFAGGKEAAPPGQGSDPAPPAGSAPAAPAALQAAAPRPFRRRLRNPAHRFVEAGAYVWSKAIVYAGRGFKAGDAVPHELVPAKKRRALWLTGRIQHVSGESPHITRRRTVQRAIAAARDRASAALAAALPAAAPG